MICSFTRNDDLPPEAPDDQPMPKTLSRLLKRGQQITQTGKQRNKTNSQKYTHGQESEFSRKKTNGPVEQTIEAKGGSAKDKQVPMFKRQRGESLKAYLERIDVESNARVMEAYRRSRKQSDRRKRCVQRS